MIWRHNLFIKEKKLGIWLEKNLIYCEDTHSFVHRLFNKIKDNKKSTYVSAQCYAFQVLSDMIREYREKKIKIKTESRLGYIGDIPIPKPPKMMKKVTIEDAMELAKESQTYKKVLIHRRTCPKWGKSFCLECFGGITPPNKLSSLLLHFESQHKICFRWVINGKDKVFKAVDQQGRTLLERGFDYSDKGKIDKNILEEMLGKKIPERTR